MHLVVHVPLGLTPAAVDNEHVDEDESDHNAYDSGNTNAITIDNGGLLNLFLHVQRLEALVGRVSEASADGVEDAQRLDLATIGFLVDDDGWVNVRAIFFPVADLVINIFVLCLGELPLLLFFPAKAILDALLCCVPVKVNEFVRSLRTLLIYDRVAC